MAAESHLLMSPPVLLVWAADVGQSHQMDVTCHHQNNPWFVPYAEVHTDVPPCVEMPRHPQPAHNATKKKVFSSLLLNTFLENVPKLLSSFTTTWRMDNLPSLVLPETAHCFQWISFSLLQISPQSAATQLPVFSAHKTFYNMKLNGHYYIQVHNTN